MPSKSYTSPPDIYTINSVVFDGIVSQPAIEEKVFTCTCPLTPGSIAPLASFLVAISNRRGAGGHSHALQLAHLSSLGDHVICPHAIAQSNRTTYV